MKKKRITIIFFLASIVLVSSIVYLSYIPPLRVSGDKFVNKWGREVRLKGFRLLKNKILYEGFNGKYTLEDFRRIKNWGFNVVEIDMFWGAELEPYENQSGFYSLDFFDSLDPFIEMAREVGLSFILSFKIVNSDNTPTEWAGWARNWYVHTPEGLERYAKCVEFFIKETVKRKWENVVAFEPYQFPFHKSTPSDSETSFYYNQVRPRLVEAVRKHSNRLIILSTMQNMIGNFNDFKMDPISEKNLAYSFTFYDYEGMTHGAGPISEWDYNETYQRELLSPAIEWKNRFRKPLFVTEWGVRGDTQPQIDVAIFKASLLEELGISWLYHSYDNHFSNNFGILYENNTEKPILEALTMYNQTIY